MKAEVEEFIEVWGAMGVLWGINRSMARVHAFMMVQKDAVDLDSIAKELNISRGNASMCLKELRNWRVIHRVYKSGERKDYYKVEENSWKMYYNVMVERKKREFDPALAALRHLMAESDIIKMENVNNRLKDMEELFSVLDKIASKALANEKTSKIMLDFFKNFAP